MSIPSEVRCDAACGSHTRCQNRGKFWLKATIHLAADIIEEWPMVVCDAHRELAQRGGTMIRLGPDRREEYQELHPEWSHTRTIGPDGL